MFDRFEQPTISYEKIDFSSLRWYQLEALQCGAKKTHDEQLNNKIAQEIQLLLTKSSPGDAVFHCLYEGLMNEDEIEVSWSMARISNLIHETANTHLGTYKKRTPKEIEFDFGTRSVARSWIKQDKSRSPIGFGSGTLAQRIFYEVNNDGVEFSMPTEDEKYYPDNLKYYLAFLKLFKVDREELSSTGNDYYTYNRTFERAHNSLTVTLDKDGFFHKFQVKPHVSNSAQLQTS